MPRFSDPEQLGPDHILGGFDCGVASLNSWLVEHARSGSGAGSARTYVISDVANGRVVGYHAMSAASIRRQDATARVVRGMPRHPVPAVLLARLAVDHDVKGKGLGAWLLRDAMLRAVSVSDELGVRAMLVHALDDNARRFYLRFGFEPSPTDAHNLQIIIKDVRAALDLS